MLVAYATAYVSATCKEDGITVLEELLEMAKQEEAPTDGEPFTCCCTNTVHKPETKNT